MDLSDKCNETTTSVTRMLACFRILRMKSIDLPAASVARSDVIKVAFILSVGGVWLVRWFYNSCLKAFKNAIE